jgi:hypothetical protein
MVVQGGYFPQHLSSVEFEGTETCIGKPFQDRWGTSASTSLSIFTGYLHSHTYTTVFTKLARRPQTLAGAQIPRPTQKTTA